MIVYYFGTNTADNSGWVGQGSTKETAKGGFLPLDCLARSRAGRQGGTDADGKKQKGQQDVAPFAFYSRFLHGKKRVPP